LAKTFNKDGLTDEAAPEGIPMQPTIQLSPKITISPNQELNTLLQAQVDLMWFCSMEDPEPHEIALYNNLQARKAEVPHIRPSEEERLATLSVNLIKGSIAFNLDELVKRFDDAIMDFDALSSHSEWLSGVVAYAKGKRLDLIEMAANAADEGHISWIGVIEHWHCVPMLDEPKAFACMVDALSILSGVFNGIFLVGAKETPNTSSHERLISHTEAMRWSVQERTQDSGLHVIADPDTEKNEILLFVGIQNMIEPKESYCLEVLQPQNT
jgi:hypothetical protein